MLHGPDKRDLVVPLKTSDRPSAPFEASPSGLPISANFHVHRIFAAAAAGAKDQKVSTGCRQSPPPFGRVPAFLRTFQRSATDYQAVGGRRRRPERPVELQDNVPFAPICLGHGHPLTGPRADSEAVAVAVGQVDILFGFTGLLSFGQSAFFGTGGMVAAYLLTMASFPYVMIAVFIGAIAAAAVGYLVGLIALRRTGITSQ